MAAAPPPRRLEDEIAMSMTEGLPATYRGSGHRQSVVFEIDTDFPELTTCVLGRSMRGYFYGLGTRLFHSHL